MPLTELGFYRPTFEEIVHAKELKARELLGDDIDTSDLTALGKFIRIDAYDLDRIYQDLELTYYARFPHTAIGISLDRAVVFAGISRNPAVFAKHRVRLIGMDGYEVLAGFLLSRRDVQFYTVQTVTLDGGSAEVDVVCTESGTTGNVTVIDTITNPDPDVFSVEYVGMLIPGEAQEGDSSLRARYEQAREGVGSANINAVRANVLRVPGVKGVNVMQNVTDETVVVGNLSFIPHSVAVIVFGGEDYKQEIAEAIFDKAPIGIATVGNEAMTVIDAGGNAHIVRFSMTSSVEIEIQATVKASNLFEVDGENQIRSNLMGFINNLGVGADVIYNTLFCRIYGVTGVTEITGIRVGRVGGTLGTVNIPIDQWEVAS